MWLRSACRFAAIVLTTRPKSASALGLIDGLRDTLARLTAA
jgi:hypothetical protein